MILLGTVAADSSACQRSQSALASATKADADAFQDAFILEAIEGNGCYCGGGISEDQINVMVELGKSCDDPEGRFAKVTAWLDARADVECWKAGPLFDLWHDDFEDMEARSAQRDGGVAESSR